MSSLFTKIINLEIPAHIVAENNQFIAFLDIMPLAKGHVLVVPKTEVDYIFNLEDELLSEIMIFSKHVANKIEKVIPCKRIGIAVIGLEVPHAHVHLVPLNDVSDINFERPKLSFPKDEMEEIAKQIALA